jgi:hypothetical protein
MSVELHRDLAMKAIYDLGIWKACWPIWEPEINKRTANLTDAQRIYELGSQLREIFFVTNAGQRGQSEVSRAGTAWECLVCWYLNLVFSGTSAVAMRQSKKTVPAVLLDATAVSYGTIQTNTESDLCVVVYPTGFGVPEVPGGYKAALDQAVAGIVGQVELGVVQCKTSWADNAQVPMLWDMVYRASFGSGTNVHIGKYGTTIDHLKRFSYSFVTVPTQKSLFKPNLMPVKRVSSLSGGNYWGMPTSPGVAYSVSEIFTRNFVTAFKQPVQASIGQAISGKVGLFANDEAQ